MINVSTTYQKTNQAFNYRKPLMFTIHSRERMSEYGINDAWVENLWQKSHRVKISLNEELYKIRKYGHVGDVRYYFRNGYLLTTGLKHGNPVLITITKQFSNKQRIK